MSIALPSFDPALLLRAQGVRVAFFDVDGVLTDGGLLIGESGEALKRFNTLDGHGLKLLRRAGIEPAVITGRDSPPLRHRLQALGLIHVHYGTEDKQPAAEQTLAALGLDEATPVLDESQRKANEECVLSRDQNHQLDPADVIRLKAFGLRDANLTSALNELADRLDPRRFVRVHRSAIVNIESILQLEPISHGEFDAVLRNGARTRVSRTYRAQLEKRLGQPL